MCIRATDYAEVENRGANAEREKRQDQPKSGRWLAPHTLNSPHVCAQLTENDD